MVGRNRLNECASYRGNAKPAAYGGNDAALLLKRVIIGRVVLCDIGRRIDQLEATAISALQVLELVAQPEHHLPRDVRFVSRSVPANFTGVHEESFREEG